MISKYNKIFQKVHHNTTKKNRLYTERKTYLYCKQINFQDFINHNKKAQSQLTRNTRKNIYKGGFNRKRVQKPIYYDRYDNIETCN